MALCVRRSMIGLAGLAIRRAVFGGQQTQLFDLLQSIDADTARRVPTLAAHESEGVPILAHPPTLAAQYTRPESCILPCFWDAKHSRCFRYAVSSRLGVGI